MLQSKEPLETNYVRIWIEKGIIHTSYPEDLVLTLDLAKKIVADRLAYTDGNDYPGLADIRNLKKVKTNAMKYFASKESFAGLSKLAVYSDSPLSKVLSNFWFRLDKPYKPTKYFTDLGSAYLYLTPIIVN